MITNNDIADAIEALVKQAFPGEPVYRDYAPTGFQRPSNLVEITGGKFYPNASCGAVELRPWVTLTTFVEVDSYHQPKQSQDLTARQMRLMGLFLPGFIKVKDRAPHVLDEGEMENGLDYAAITRGSKGTVPLIVRDGVEEAPFAITQASQVPAALGKETQDYIKRAFLGYVTPPKKVIVYVLAADGKLADALDYMSAQTFDYICGPADCTAEEAAGIAGWVKSQRQNDGAKFKAVLPNHKADDYAVINFTGDAMTDGSTVWTTAEYCSRIAGLLAGTPMKISATYAPLPELSDCARLTKDEADEAVGNGELALRWDGRKVKLNRAVTSLTTTSQGILDSFKKIKIVEAMDLIRTDITATAEDEYVGKYANSYDNKLLLITAIRGYFMGLEQGQLVKSGYTVDLDVDRIEQYLVSRGVNTEEMTEQQIREADTGSHVFIRVRCKLLDAIEDICIEVEI